MYVQNNSKIVVHEGARNNLPDQDSHNAALAIQKLASGLTSNDILIVLISGTCTNYLCVIWPGPVEYYMFFVPVLR